MPPLTIATPGLSLTLVPEWGGKVTSLRDQRTGREWLWQNPHLPHRAPTGSGDFVGESDTGGWDECFPTVDRCAYPLPPHEGRDCRDHGLLWERGWRVEGQRADAITLSVDLPEWGFHVERTVRLHDVAMATFDYAIQNTGSEALVGVWATHPVFALEDGSRLEFPEGTTVRFSHRRGAARAWAAGREVVPAHELPLVFRDVDPLGPESFAAKFMTERLPEPRAALVHPDGSRLGMEFPAGDFDGFAVWANQRGWSGKAGIPPYLNLCLEPQGGRRDSLADAVAEHALLLRFDAGATRRMRLSLRVAGPAR